MALFNLSRVLHRGSIQKSTAVWNGTRRMNEFRYPHSFTGVNNSFTNMPSHNVYPEIPRDAHEGDKAHLAHQNVRKFPDWYKPYGLNYQGDGWLAFFLGAFAICGYSYLNDIKEIKGRK